MAHRSRYLYSGDVTDASLTMPTDLLRDRLIGDWHIYQRSGGHKTSTDDLITAWFAKHRSNESPASYLDLGCGIGSVLLMVAHSLRPLRSVGVEAQAQSYAMAKRAIAELPSKLAIEVRHGDFRQTLGELPLSQSGDLGPEEQQLGTEHYDLITGSPPYFPLGTGVLPNDEQRKACRFEIRGGVEDYCLAASRTMHELSRFYLVFPSAQSDRAIQAAAAANLHLSAKAIFKMRSDREQPFLSVFEFAKAEPSQETPLYTRHLAVRDEHGTISQEYQEARAELGVG